MKMRFRTFIRSQEQFPCNLREQDAPPPVNPDSPETTNKDHIATVSAQMGMEEDDAKKAIEDTSITVFIPYNFKGRDWPFLIKGPVQIKPTERSDESGIWDVKFFLKGKPGTDFYLPYKQGEVPTQYEGDIPDTMDAVMTYGELKNIMATPLDPHALGDQGAAQMPGMGGPMGDPMAAQGMGPPGGGMASVGQPPTVMGGPA